MRRLATITATALVGAALAAGGFTVGALQAGHTAPPPAPHPAAAPPPAPVTTPTPPAALCPYGRIGVTSDGTYAGCFPGLSSEPPIDGARCRDILGDDAELCDAIDRGRARAAEWPHRHESVGDDYVRSREWYEDREQERRLDQLEAEAQRRRSQEQRWKNFPQQQQDCQKYGGVFC